MMQRNSVPDKSSDDDFKRHCNVLECANEIEIILLSCFFQKFHFELCVVCCILFKKFPATTLEYKMLFHPVIIKTCASNKREKESGLLTISFAGYCSAAVRRCAHERPNASRKTRHYIFHPPRPSHIDIFAPYRSPLEWQLCNCIIYAPTSIISPPVDIFFLRYSLVLASFYHNFVVGRKQGSFGLFSTLLSHVCIKEIPVF